MSDAEHNATNNKPHAVRGQSEQPGESMSIANLENEVYQAGQAGTIPQTTRKSAGALVNWFLDTIKQEILDNGELRLKGVGTFTIVRVAPKKGRNPQTGEALTIPSKKKVKFKVAKDFAEAALKGTLKPGSK